MSYSAYVVCNCYKQGLATEPPYKELVTSDEEGIYLQLPDGLWEKDKALFLRMDAEFDAWKEGACVHPGMEAASEYLANMSGMAAFRTIVQEHGGTSTFPVLASYLPQANGGTLPAEHAPALLQELELLAAQPAEVLAALREQQTGELVFSVNENSNVIFIFTGSDNHRYGLDKEGFFILKEQHSFFSNRQQFDIKFRSMNFTQRYMAKNRYRFTDLISGATYEASVGLRIEGAEPKSDATFNIVLETVPLAREYTYILIPLRTLAVAAMQTGNPICWT